MRRAEGRLPKRTIWSKPDSLLGRREAIHGLLAKPATSARVPSYPQPNPYSSCLGPWYPASPGATARAAKRPLLPSSPWTQQIPSHRRLYGSEPFTTQRRHDVTCHFSRRPTGTAGQQIPSAFARQGALKSLLYPRLGALTGSRPSPSSPLRETGTGAYTVTRPKLEDPARHDNQAKNMADETPADSKAGAPAFDAEVGGKSGQETEVVAGSSSGGHFEEGPEEQEKLPPLSAHEFKQYNRLSEHMDYFHNHFRQTWTRLYSAASNNKRPPGTSIRHFIEEGLQFISHLTAHHSIEETYLFPLLAKKMPEFQSGTPPKHLKTGSKGKQRQALLLQQHKDIHEGMDVFEDYLRDCKRGEKDFEMAVLKEKMDSWGGVLWEHLDLEVKTLGAENMRKYWSLEEMRRLPM